MACARTVRLIFLVSIVLFLCAAIMIFTSSTNSAEPVSITITGEDGREFIHPGEEITITIFNLDSIDSMNVTGKTTQDITNWDGVPGEYTVEFSAPDHEGEHTIQVSGYQEGKWRSERAMFFVEAFEIFIFPRDNVLISNGGRAKTTPDTDSQIRSSSTTGTPITTSPITTTPVYVKFVDWKGDPRSGLLHISITRTTSGIAAEDSLDDFQLQVDGGSSFMFDPEKYLREGDPVSGSYSYNTTIYHFNAVCMDYPDRPASECGIVVHPFQLELEGERTIIHGGGSSINGPFFRREPIRIDINTSGTIGVITLTDLINPEDHQFLLNGTRLQFQPENVTIYQLHVTATLDGAHAETIMIIPVNDWPVTVDTATNVLAGEEYTIDVRRENGGFFGVRALLFNEYSIPTTAIMDIIETDSSSSPYYEKGLLDSDGKTTMTFITPTNMMGGNFFLMVGLGSWDDSGVSYHGISLVKVRFSRLMISGPGDVMINEMFTLAVSELDGFPGMDSPDLPDVVQGDHRDHRSSDAADQAQHPINGTLTIDGAIWNIVDGAITLSLDRTGIHHCLFSKTGRDVTSFDIQVYNHSLFLQAPDYLLTGQEFIITLWDESNMPIRDSQVHMTLEKGGIFVRNETFSQGNTSFSSGSLGRGDYLLSFALHDFVPVVHRIQVFSYIRIQYVGEPVAGSPFHVKVMDPYGRYLDGITLFVQGLSYTQNVSGETGSFYLTLETGDHEFQILNNGFILYRDFFHVVQQEEASSDLGSISTPISLMLLILFIMYVSTPPFSAQEPEKEDIRNRKTTNTMNTYDYGKL